MNLDLKAPVFDIQSFCIHDGPGIRTTIFLKGCPLTCKWCQNPESQSAAPQLMFYADKCLLCGACIDACPYKAVSISEGGFIQNNRDLCRNCGNCVSTCRHNARELVGTTMTVKEVYEEIKKERIFLLESGGGITLSGGEMLNHPGFSKELLMLAQSEGIHTCVETSCYAAHRIIEAIFPFVDFALIDLKHMNSEVHKRFTGVPNEPILENIAWIHDHSSSQIIIRFPVIPGFNDDETNIHATASFIESTLGRGTHVDLLPYHNLGNSKCVSLGISDILTLTPPSNEHMEKIKYTISSYGLEVQIGG